MKCEEKKTLTITAHLIDSYIDVVNVVFGKATIKKKHVQCEELDKEGTTICSQELIIYPKTELVVIMMYRANSLGKPILEPKLYVFSLGKWCEVP